MTRLEAQQYLSHKKIYLKNKIDEVTNKLLDLGYQWENIDIHLYIYIDNVWNVHGTTNPNEFYTNQDYEEISVEDLLNLKVTSDAEYRPFKNDTECWDEMKKHEPFGWVKNVDDERYFIYEVNFGIGTSESFHPYNEALCTVKFLDDTPFGIKVK